MAKNNLTKLAAIYKSQKTKEGGLGHSLSDRSKKKYDPRQFINQTGLLATIFSSLFKSYKSTPRNISNNVATPPVEKFSNLNIGSESSNKLLEIIAGNTKIMAKNVSVLPSINRDTNIIRQNIGKLVKMQGGTASQKADMYFKKSSDREKDYESHFAKTGRPVAVTSREKEQSGGITDLFSKIFKGALLVGAIAAIGKYLLMPENIQKVVDFFVGLMEGIKQFAKFTSGVIKELFKNKEFMNGIRDTFLEIFSLLSTVISEGSNTLTEILQNKEFNENISKIFISIFEAIKSAFIFITNNLKDPQIQEKINGVIDSFIGMIKQLLFVIHDGLSKALQNQFNLGEGTSKTLSTVIMGLVTDLMLFNGAISNLLSLLTVYGITKGIGGLIPASAAAGAGAEAGAAVAGVSGAPIVAATFGAAFLAKQTIDAVDKENKPFVDLKNEYIKRKNTDNPISHETFANVYMQIQDKMGIKSKDERKEKEQIIESLKIFDSGGRITPKNIRGFRAEDKIGGIKNKTKELIDTAKLSRTTEGEEKLSKIEKQNVVDNSKLSTSPSKTENWTYDLSTKSTSSNPVAESGNAQEALQFFQEQGWSKEQSAGIVGNLQSESTMSLKTNTTGDGGKAYGIAQWHADRQEQFKKVFGKDIKESSFKEQLQFVDWELKNTESKSGQLLKNAQTASEAASIIDQYYERSKGFHRQKRIDLANNLINTKSNDSPLMIASSDKTENRLLKPESRVEQKSIGPKTPIEMLEDISDIIDKIKFESQNESVSGLIPYPIQPTPQAPVKQSHQQSVQLASASAVDTEFIMKELLKETIVGIV